MTDHAHELRRHARKIAHPAGDVPAVMTRYDVIRMARESGMLIPWCQLGCFMLAPITAKSYKIGNLKPISKRVTG